MAVSGKVWIVDFGSQYTQLIARRVRELSVYSEMVLPDITAKDIEENDVAALILSGGPSSVYEDKAPNLDPKIFDLNLPVLGICYGLQLMSRHFGARVHSDNRREYGRSAIHIKKETTLLSDISDGTIVWMSHGDHVDTLPTDFEIVAASDNNAPAALVHRQKKLMGLQFHPEVVHTVEGTRFFENFLFKIAGLKRDWTAEHFVAQATAQIRETVGSAKVLMALSGGVDSSVMGVLMYRAIGKQCVPVFINNGLLRKNEQFEVVQKLRKMGLPIRMYNCSAQFLGALKGVKNPERKRKIIGYQFIKAFERIAKSYPDISFLAQGTLYPDVIESRSVNGPSQIIKSHHNVGGLPKRMKLDLIEPFNSLFKDEVRNIGRELGMPEDILERHPFPGPGLAVRIIGEITSYRLAVLRKADEIFIDELKKSGEYYRVWQAFAVLIPVKTVGVMGDQRTYEHVIALRSVNSSDGMTADWSPIPNEVLSRIASRIVNEVRGINRVVYDITSKPPGTIEWE
ncbi:MAG: glutamine-hydrolyzing GMP synthase [Candidatus Marinimicrobia bacterium]|nr:glutamine-hydrolyzing GMP synthase [Candidatus Neomarinimicrobiota bacterium]RKY61960.1 MAG: GMP synthase (glutamine-hydrolyzing) [Candidatus Neomarinimicrobiota bacterium]